MPTELYKRILELLGGPSEVYEVKLAPNTLASLIATKSTSWPVVKMLLVLYPQR